MRNEIAIRERAAAGARIGEHIASINDAIDEVERQYAEDLLNTFNPEGRERLWVAVQVCRKVKEHFGSLVGGGKLAQHQLQELSKPR